MKQIKPKKSILVNLTILCALILFTSSLVQAQGLSGSVSFDILPYQDFKDSVELDDGSYTDSAQVQLSKTSVTLAYPFIFSEGRTVLINEFSYQLIEFQFRNMTTPLEKAHSGSYTLMLQHQLSEKWSMWAIATPSIASDLKAEVSKHDFNFQTAAIFIRKYSDKLSIGYGAAYSTQFGSAVPMPVLAFDWNNGKNLMIKGIIPVSLEMWYKSSERLDLGLLLSGDGNNYRGDPAIYSDVDDPVDNPELRYTMMTFGPATKFKITEKLALQIEAGIIGLHKFEFYDGDKEKDSYSLKPSQYVRFGIQFGN